MKFLLLSLPFFLSAIFSLSVSTVSLAVSSNPPGETGADVSYFDSNNDGTYDKGSVTTYHEFLRELPDDEPYNVLNCYDATEQPIVLTSSTGVSFGDLTLAQGSCQFTLDLNKTYALRMCLQKETVEQPEDNFCPADYAITTESDPVEPAQPPDPEQPGAYTEPRFGTKVGILVSLALGAGVVYFFFKAYVPKGRR